MASIVEIIVRTIDESTGKTGNIAGSFTELQSAVMLGREALEAVGKAYEGTVGKAMAYADEVRQLSLVTGMSTENSSRFLDVGEKLGVQFGTLQTALKFMAKNGVEPSLDGMAKLADQYNALQDPIQKDQFLIHEFGRSGLDMAMMLSQGSTELRNLNSQVNQGLILTQQQVDAAHRNKIATQELTESWTAFTIQIGNAAIPTITNVINGLLTWNAAEDKAIEKGQTFHTQSYLAMRGYVDQEAAIAKARSSTNDYADAAERAAARNQALAASNTTVTTTAKDLSSMYQGQLSLLGSMQAAETSYESKTKSLADERAALEQERALKISQGYQAAGATIQALDKKLADNAAASAENANQHDLDSKKIILGYMEQQMAADGLTTQEVAFLLRKGQEWGVYSDSVVKDAAAAEAEVQTYIDTLNGIPGHINTVLELRQIYGDDVRLAGSGGSDRRRALGGLEGYAGGGRRVIVGEWGPEMVDLPQGANVHTAGDTRAMQGGGAPVNLNVNIPPGAFLDPQAAARQLMPALFYALRSAGVRVNL